MTKVLILALACVAVVGCANHDSPGVDKKVMRERQYDQMMKDIGNQHSPSKAELTATLWCELRTYDSQGKLENQGEPTSEVRFNEDGTMVITAIAPEDENGVSKGEDHPGIWELKDSKLQFSMNEDKQHEVHLVDLALARDEKEKLTLLRISSNNESTMYANCKVVPKNQQDENQNNQK